ncbi:MAG: dihydrodipicolinate synthase family protein [Opitutus sp.]|nr:dihydrodipicolinate synthase family protein [Opitutus sp.]
MTTPLPPLRLRRPIEGISAVLLPFTARGEIDFAGWETLCERTWQAGLAPAVNMDTGYANLLTPAERADLLARAGKLARGRRFIAGAFIVDRNGDATDLYLAEIAAIRAAGGTPILFQSPALKALGREKMVALYRRVAAEAGELLAFELGEMFAPFGAIYDLETVRALMEIPELKGMKHSSLSRELEWQRLALRDEVRPDFKLYTGNDLAIDMVQWGSDYLLGLSAFYPEAFAVRDACWAAGRPEFYELNDWLQYLGMLAFRAPVPAYKHTCAQTLRLCGIIASSEPHPRAARRPDSDEAILQQIVEKLDQLTAAARAALAN